MAAKRRKRRRRRVSRDQMTPEEIRRAKKRAIRRKRERARRRFYAALFFALLAFAVVFFLFLKKDKKEDSVSANAASEEHGEAGPSYGAGGEPVDLSVSTDDIFDGDYAVSGDEVYQIGDLSGIINTSVPVDVTSGKVAFTMDTVSGNRIIEAKNLKLAMEHASYFTGTSTQVHNVLARYGEGKWHAIKKTVNEMTVFYSGVHRTEVRTNEAEKKSKKQKGEEEEPAIRYKDVPFQVNFIVYEDGSFIVQSVEEGGQAVDDFEAWLNNRMAGE